MLQLGVETGEKRMKRGQMKGNETHILYGFSSGGTDRGPSASECQSSVRARLLGKTRELERVEVRNGQG
jgi:hypothetical protein